VKHMITIFLQSFAWFLCARNNTKWEYRAQNERLSFGCC